MVKRLGITCAVLAVFLFSYAPFIYIIEFIGTTKKTTFVILLCTSLLAIFINNKWRPFASKGQILAILFALPFSFYALVSYLSSGEYLLDSQTVVVLSCINILVVYLAINWCESKTTAVIIMLLLSGVYFIRTTFMFFDDTLVRGLMGTVRVFDVTETDSYNNMNEYLGMFIVVVFSFILNLNKVSLSIIYSIICLFALYLMFFIGGRAPIVGISTVILFGVLSLSHKHIKHLRRNHVYLILGGLGLLAIVALAIDFEKLYAIQRFTALLHGDTSERLYLYKEAIDLFLSSPNRFFFGAGMGYYPVYIDNNIEGMYPHNFVLELLAEYGIVGTTLFLLLPAHVLITRKKRIGSMTGNNFTERVLFYMFLYFLVMAMFTGGLRGSWPLLFVLSMLYIDKSNMGKYKAQSKDSCLL